MSFKKSFLLFFIFVIKNGFVFSCDKDFIQSFVQHYEFNVEGRYTHEYHPFLLDKTARSLDGLEESLRSEDFNLFGRIVICGYEEQAVPTYYTNYAKPKINDEASFKHEVGWSLKLHNIFGFMTGFLFKDLDYFNKLWFKNKDTFFEHINAHKIEIFRDNADIFQEHAFGQAYCLITQAEPEVLKKIKEQDCKGVFNKLLNFWKVLYENAMQSTGKQVAGTADIFFSIEYARHLIRSSMPFLKFYTGPDITYPVEVSLKQEKGATENAQDFARAFSKQLIARDGKNTVYIFCSFVDGVGKSTLLGNVKNYLKYGNEVESFNRVDNSSSQLADIFKVKENVFIADLPAQVSHFTYKPDGLVFVSAEREMKDDDLEKVKAFARNHKDRFEQNYKKLLLDVKNEININGYFSQNLNSRKNIEKSFVKNLFLLKKEESNFWIPFKFEEQFYLFKLNDLSQVRILSPLGSVQSEGLKNVESEQMLFFDGICFPLPYPSFLNDFITKLKKAEIENIIFVDFISMYPRSSRENIRINYLLQQLALLYSGFDSQFSLYRNFINDSELLFLLQQKEAKNHILRSFETETLVRLAMYNLIVNRKDGGITGINMQELTSMIQGELSSFSEEDLFLTQDIVCGKVHNESIKLEDIYGFTKSFINIQKINFDDIFNFSEKLIQFFTDYNFIQNEDLRDLWEFPSSNISTEKEIITDGVYNQFVNFDSNLKFYALHSFNECCRDENLLSPFIRNLRAAWYAAISNLIFSKGADESSVEVKTLKYLVPPFVVKKDNFERFYLLRKVFDAHDDKISKNVKKLEDKFNLKPSVQSSWGTFADEVYRLDWQSKATNCGIYAFESDLNAAKKTTNRKSIITFLVQKFQRDYGSDAVLTTSKLYELLKDCEMWKREWKSMVNKAKKNTEKRDKKKNTQGNRKDDDKKKDKKKSDKDKKDKKKKKSGGESGLWGDDKGKKVYLISEEQKGSIQLFTRFIATLEMVLKDPESDIVVRKNNKKDFKACLKLLEKTTLPKYFGLLSEDSLFDDYDNVEPVIDLYLD